MQALWVLRLFLPEHVGFVGFFVLAAMEVSIPVWAESHRSTPWNAHHIAERYSLFTLILLGESILAAANSILAAIGDGQHISDLMIISAAGLVIAAGMWWVYFAREQHRHITTLKSSLVFGYFHYLIFAAAGAFSAGIEVSIDSAAGHAGISTLIAAATLTVPVALFVLGIWTLTLRHVLTPTASSVVLIGIGVILAATFLPGTAAILATAVGITIAAIATETHRDHNPQSNTR